MHLVLVIEALQNHLPYINTSITVWNMKKSLKKILTSIEFTFVFLCIHLHRYTNVHILIYLVLLRMKQHCK